MSVLEKMHKARFVKFIPVSHDKRSDRACFKLGVFVNKWIPVPHATYNFFTDEITLDVDLVRNNTESQVELRANDETLTLEARESRFCNAWTPAADCFSYHVRPLPSHWNTSLTAARQNNQRVPWDVELRDTFLVTDDDSFPVIPNEWTPGTGAKRVVRGYRALMQIGVGDDPDTAALQAQLGPRHLQSHKVRETYDDDVCAYACKRNQTMIWGDDCTNHFREHNSEYQEVRCQVDADAACDHAVKDAGELGDNHGMGTSSSSRSPRGFKSRLSTTTPRPWRRATEHGLG